MSHGNVAVAAQEKCCVTTPKNAFSFDPQSYKDGFQSRDYVHATFDVNVALGLFAQTGISAADEPDLLDCIRRLGEFGGIDFLN